MLSGFRKIGLGLFILLTVFRASSAVPYENSYIVPLETAVSEAESAFSYDYGLDPAEIVVLDTGVYQSRSGDAGWWVVKLGNAPLSISEVYTVSHQDETVSVGWDEIVAHENTDPAWPGKIHPLLLEQLQAVDPDAPVRVIFVLAEHPDIRTLQKEAADLYMRKNSGDPAAGAETEDGGASRNPVLRNASGFNRLNGQLELKRLIARRKGTVLFSGRIRNHLVAVLPAEAVLALAESQTVLEVQPDLLCSGPIQTGSPADDLHDFENEAPSGNDNGYFPIDLGIVDTGIDAGHPALSVHRAVNFSTDGAGSDDYQGHGTRAAGVSSCRDPDYPGVAPSSRLWNLKAGVKGPNGEPLAYTGDILQAVDYAIEHVIETINLSLTYHLQGDDVISFTDGSYELSKTLDAAANAGLVTTAAAGDSGPDAHSIGIPGDAFNVITVGAAGKMGDTVYEPSGRGPTGGAQRTKPECTAPGVAVTSTAFDFETAEYFQSWNGTGMAAPHAAGVAALVTDRWASKYGERLSGGASDLIPGGPLLVRSVLLASSEPLYGLQEGDNSLNNYAAGAGRIDGERALSVTGKAHTRIMSLPNGHRKRLFVLGPSYVNPATEPYLKAAVTWDRYPDRYELPTDLSDIDLEIREPGGAVLDVSADLETNWEKVRAETTDMESPGIYLLDIVANRVPEAVGTETVALATDGVILPPWPTLSFDDTPYADGIVGRPESNVGYNWYVAKGGGAGFADSELWASQFGSNGDHVLAGDFNGDGNTDLARARISEVPEGVQVTWSVVESEGGQSNEEFDWGTDFFSTDQDLRFFPGDFDADGFCDIAVARISDETVVEWSVIRSVGEAFAPSRIYIEDFGDGDDSFYTGDFNGDGRVDIAAAQSGQSGAVSWHVALSEGLSFTDSGRWIESFGVSGDRFFTGDFNGDGWTDLADAGVSEDGKVRWTVAISDGSRFFFPTVWSEDFGNRSDSFLVGDFTGDGAADFAIVRTINSHTLRWYVGKSSDYSISEPELWSWSFGRQGDAVIRAR